MFLATPLPAFLHAFQQHWPFPTVLAGCSLVSTRFDQQQLTAADFSNNAITAPKATQKRQAEFLSARLCARHALLLQTGHSGLPMAQADSRAPLWPAQSCGSMSHSHGIAAAIVGASQHWQNLGLDIEKPISVARAQRLFNAILTPTEQQRYHQLDQDSAAWYLTYVFSLKESLFKALNPLTEVYFTFQDAQVLDFNLAEAGCVRLQLCQSLSAEWPSCSELQGQFARLHDSAITLVTVPARPK